MFVLPVGLKNSQLRQLLTWGGTIFIMFSGFRKNHLDDDCNIWPAFAHVWYSGKHCCWHSSDIYCVAHPSTCALLKSPSPSTAASHRSPPLHISKKMGHPGVRSQNPNDRTIFSCPSAGRLDTFGNGRSNDVFRPRLSVLMLGY